MTGPRLHLLESYSLSIGQREPVLERIAASYLRAHPARQQPFTNAWLSASRLRHVHHGEHGASGLRVGHGGEPHDAPEGKPLAVLHAGGRGSCITRLRDRPIRVNRHLPLSPLPSVQRAGRRPVLHRHLGPLRRLH